MSEEGERTCPLCMEEMDLTDQQLKPCKCGYEICVWCWHHLMEMAEKDGTEGRCPACRVSYDKEKIVGMAVNSERLAELNTEKKQKFQKAKSKASEARKHLSTVRVIQRNLVYIVGLPANLADEEVQTILAYGYKVLQRKEYFGQYGKILKVSISRNAAANQHPSATNSCSVYVTYSKDEEALRCIQVVNGYILDGRPLRACFGTTKYCHAWLRNMPCGNPDCLYLHDSGSQEDTFTKDEALSTCAGKFQHTPGSVLNNIQRRSGNLLPPPLDNFCSNSYNASARPFVKPNTGGYNKIFPNGDTEKFSGLPSAASWGVRVAPSRSSITSPEVTPETTKHKSTASNVSIVSFPAAEGQCRTWTHDKDKPTNEASLSNGRVVTYPQLTLSSRKDSLENLIESHVVGLSSSTSRVTNTIREPYCSIKNKDSCSYDQQPSTDETAESSERTSEALTLEPLHDAVSTSYDVLCTKEKCGEDSELEEKMSANLETQTMSATVKTRANDLSESCIGDISRDPFVDIPSSSTSEFTETPKYGNEKFKVSHMEYASQHHMFLNKTGSQNSFECEEPGIKKRDESGENSIIADILSLDLGMDDPSVSPHNIAKLLLGDNGRINGNSKLFSPWKSGCNSESRFSFARIDDYNLGNREHTSSLSTHRGGQSENLDQLEIMGNQGVNVNNWPSGVTGFDSRDAEILSNRHHRSHYDISALPSFVRPEVSPPSRSPIQRKVPSIPPPGFSQHAADRDQSFPMHHFSGFTSQYQFPSCSASFNSPPQITGNLSCVDVEFIDPAIMAVGKGKLPLSTPHLQSPNYSSNLLGFSEIDQRIQMLKSIPSNFNQYPMMAMDQSKYNLLQGLALQEAMRNSNAPWGSWNLASPTAISSGLLTRRGQSTLPEIVNNGRNGYLESQYGFRRPFSVLDDTKFQSPSSSGFNSAYNL